MRNRFDEDMARLHASMIEMGAQCESAIASAVKALLETDEKNARRAVLLEDTINEKVREIENLCMKLLLRQQPVAKDFRRVSSALKMITDMERIGDQAEDIAEIAVLGTVGSGENHQTVKEMALAAIGMVTGAVSAYVDEDTALAEKVIGSDDAVDGLFDKLRHGIAVAMAQKPGATEAAVDLLMVAKYLERIGDHAVNIAEWVIYSVTGTHYKDSEKAGGE